MLGHNSNKIDLLRKKLQWRSKRSMLELDLILDRFIKSESFAKLSIFELVRYKKLLLLDDNYLLSLLYDDKHKLLSHPAIKKLVILIKKDSKM